MPYADPEKRREWARKRWEKSQNDPELRDKLRKYARESQRRRMQNPEIRAQAYVATKQWVAKHSFGYRAVKLRTKYGLSIDDYNAMLRSQNWVCAICQQPETRNTATSWLSVDHNHDSGKIRGLLCRSCNQGIGALRSTEICRNAVVYLEQAQSNDLMALLRMFPNPPISENIKLRRISYNLKYRFGITWLAFRFLEQEQNAVCKICGQPEPRFLRGKRKVLSIDHCHESGKIRGLLCSRCNPGIGYLHHDQNLLLKAANYLEKWDG